MNLKELQAKYAGLWKEVNDLALAGTMDETFETKNAELAALDKQIAALKALAASAPPDLRTGFDPGAPDEPETEPTADELKSATLKSVNIIRYSSDIDANQEHILGEVYEQPWRQLFAEQDVGFKAFLRLGGEYINMPRELYKKGQKRHWDVGDVMDMLKDGLSVEEIKATMVSGSDTLGGYAVPPQRARRILQEAMGLTVVRQAGAYVIRTTSTSVDWLRITGGTFGQYPGALRGEWGGETQTPTAKNLTFGLQTITTSLYTYKIPVAQTLLETAQNIVSIIQTQIAETIAIDEDLAFLFGDGLNGPRGIMPDGTPDTDIAVLTSGTSGTFKVDDLKSLRRQIASRYRMAGRSVYAFSNATADHIEAMQDSEGRFYFDSVGTGERIFGAPSHESEAIPDIASEAHPVIYGDMRGYAIAEAGPGLEIFRFRDSSTGPNVVEFHVRRRLGGRVVEAYRLAALKCLA